MAYTLGGVGLKRPSANDFNIKNFVAEFSLQAWITTFFAYVFVWMTLTLLLTGVNGWKKQEIETQMGKGFGITLRTIINKV